MNYPKLIVSYWKENSIDFKNVNYCFMCVSGLKSEEIVGVVIGALFIIIIFLFGIILCTR